MSLLYPLSVKEFRDHWQSVQNQVTTSQELAEEIQKIWPSLARLVSPQGRQKQPELLEIQFENLSFRQCVSNTHSAPPSGVTNWWCRPNLPRGYPGWQGNLILRFSSSLPEFTHYYFKELGIYTGTGGGSRSNLRFQCQFWAEQWPAWRAVEEKHMIWEALNQ